VLSPWPPEDDRSPTRFGNSLPCYGGMAYQGRPIAQLWDLRQGHAPSHAADAGSEYAAIAECGEGATTVGAVISSAASEGAVDLRIHLKMLVYWAGRYAQVSHPPWQHIIFRLGTFANATRLESRFTLWSFGRRGMATWYALSRVGGADSI